VESAGANLCLFNHCKYCIFDPVGLFMHGQIVGLSVCVPSVDLSTLIERTPSPRRGFQCTMFPDQEPGGRGPPLKNYPQNGCVSFIDLLAWSVLDAVFSCVMRTSFIRSRFDQERIHVRYHVGYGMFAGE